jgi:hypothetical protein
MPTTLQPATPRAQILDEVSRVRVTIPARRNWFVILFLPLWLAGWAAGDVAVLSQVIDDPPTGGEGPFILVWLVLWNVFGPLFALFWLWTVAGKEIVTLDAEVLSLRYALGRVGWTRRFARDQVAALRVSPSATAEARSLAWWPGAGTIAFDYGARTYRFGSGLDEAEAKQVAADLRRRLEPPEPF